MTMITLCNYELIPDNLYYTKYIIYIEDNELLRQWLRDCSEEIYYRKTDIVTVLLFDDPDFVLKIRLVFPDIKITIRDQPAKKYVNNSYYP